MKKGLWNQKELKILLWALSHYSEHLGRKIDDFVKILKFFAQLSNFNAKKLDVDWHEISQLFVSNNGLKCKAKWLSIQRSKHLQEKWTLEEDNQLCAMMK